MTSMIEAHELRLGNKFGCFYDNKLIVTASVIKLDIYGNIEWKLDVPENVNFKGEFSPIPLTPEILEKCGSRMEDESHYNEAGEKITPSVSFYWQFPSAAIHVRYMNHPKEIYCWIKYNMRERRSYMSDELNFYENQHVLRSRDLKLHQFQNIIFALTGEELTVNIL